MAGPEASSPSCSASPGTTVTSRSGRTSCTPTPNDSGNAATWTRLLGAALDVVAATGGLGRPRSDRTAVADRGQRTRSATSTPWPTWSPSASRRRWIWPSARCGPRTAATCCGGRWPTPPRVCRRVRLPPLGRRPGQGPLDPGPHARGVRGITGADPAGRRRRLAERTRCRAAHDAGPAPRANGRQRGGGGSDCARVDAALGSRPGILNRPCPDLPRPAATVAAPSSIARPGLRGMAWMCSRSKTARPRPCARRWSRAGSPCRSTVPAGVDRSRSITRGDRWRGELAGLTPGRRHRVTVHTADGRTDRPAGVPHTAAAGRGAVPPPPSTTCTWARGQARDGSTRRTDQAADAPGHSARRPERRARLGSLDDRGQGRRVRPVVRPVLGTRALSLFAAVPVPVWMLPGNHDTGTQRAVEPDVANAPGPADDPWRGAPRRRRPAHRAGRVGHPRRRLG